MNTEPCLVELARKEWQGKGQGQDRLLIQMAEKAVYERLGNHQWQARYTVKDTHLPHVEIKLCNGMTFWYENYSLGPSKKIRCESLRLVKKKLWGLLGTELSQDIRNLADLGKVLEHWEAERTI